MSLIGSSVTQSVAATGQAQRQQTERTDREKNATSPAKARELDRVDVHEAEKISRVHPDDEHHEDEASKRRRGRDGSADADAEARDRDDDDDASERPRLNVVA